MICGVVLEFNSSDYVMGIFVVVVYPIISMKVRLE